MPAKVCLLLFLFAANCHAQLRQDSVLMLNGKVHFGEIMGFDIKGPETVLKLNTMSKKDKIKTEYISTYRIFSYTTPDSSKTLYEQDEFMGNYLTVRETHDVTIGSYDARKTFTPHVPFWTGFALGFGASLFDTYLTKKEASDTSLIAPKQPGFFRKDPSVFPFIVPVVASVSWAFPSFRLKEKNMLHKNYLNNENYYRGYHRIAKQKRMLGGLFGSLSGILSGMIIYYAVQ